MTGYTRITIEGRTESPSRSLKRGVLSRSTKLYKCLYLHPEEINSGPKEVEELLSRTESKSSSDHRDEGKVCFEGTLMGSSEVVVE